MIQLDFYLLVSVVGKLFN